MQKKSNKESKKEKEDKRTKWIVELGFVVDWVVQKTNEKHARTQFNTTWSSTTIIEVGDHFHHDFKSSLWAHPHKYRGVNLGCTTWVQQ